MDNDGVICVLFVIFLVFSFLYLNVVLTPSGDNKYTENKAAALSLCQHKNTHLP